MKPIYRLLSVNLALVILSLLFVFPLSAASASLITVNGVSFDRSSDKSGDGWSYSASKNTLTLDSYSGSSIRASGDLVVYAKNTVALSGDSESGKTSDSVASGPSAIYVTGTLKLTVEGDLTATAAQGIGNGIYAKELVISSVGNSSVTVRGTGSANAIKAGTADISAYKLYAYGGENASALYFTSSLNIHNDVNADFIAGENAQYAITYLSGAVYTFGETLTVRHENNSASVSFMPDVIYGDIHADGEIDIKDAVLLAQYLAEWEISLSPKALESADVFHDGKINVKDSVRLAQYLAEWDVTLGS